MGMNRAAYELAEILALADINEVPEVRIVFPSLNAKYRFEAQLKREMQPHQFTGAVNMGDFEVTEFRGIKFKIRARERHAIS